MKQPIVIIAIILAVLTAVYFGYKKYLVDTIVKEAAIDKESLDGYDLFKLRSLLKTIRASSERPEKS